MKVRVLGREGEGVYRTQGATGYVTQACTVITSSPLLSWNGTPSSSFLDLSCFVLFRPPLLCSHFRLFPVSLLPRSLRGCSRERVIIIFGSIYNWDQALYLISVVTWRTWLVGKERAAHVHSK